MLDDLTLHCTNCGDEFPVCVSEILAWDRRFGGDTYYCPECGDLED